MASPTVSAIRNTMPVSSDSLDSSIATRVTIHTARWDSGTRSVMQRTSTTEQATTTRNVAIARPGNGASSVWRKWRSGMRSGNVRTGAGSETVSAGMARGALPQSGVPGAPSAGQPRMIATADAPTRKTSGGSGFSTRMRTGNRCAMCTQLSSRLICGTPAEIG